uniref:non-specific serine/threonine protein kinase n=1 Tax=Leersia perrieri TaxID=77586 RepID=A0A0D9WJE7_9ORYZ
MAQLLIHLVVVFLSFLASASVAAASAGAVCKSPVFCGEHVEIKYPFFLSNTTEDVVLTDKNTSVPSHCGYPWLGIICEDNGKRAILRLGRDNYTVLEINHDNHTVTVADTDALDATTACPRVKHNVTLPPVLRFPIPNNDSIAFFFDCDFTGNFAEPADIAPINCSGFGRGQPSALPSFVVAEPDTPEGEWWKACKEVYVAPVMKTWLVSNLYYQRLGEDGYGQVLKRGFQLSWDPTAGDCHRCEISGSRGRCSYDNSTTFIGCLCSDGHVSTTVCGTFSGSKTKLQAEQQMHPLYALPLLITLLLSSVPLSVPESDAYFRYRNCAPADYQCGSLKFEVDYPFSANGVDRPDYCSYPGYRFFCTTDSKLMIYMNSTAFQVTDFDYRNKILIVVDQNQPQETCPDRYHNTTIDESRFMFTDRDQNLTVYVNCSASLSSLPFIYDLASCLSGGKSYYKLDNSLAPEVLGSCNSTVVVPCNSTMAGLLATENSSLVDVIRGGFTVRWKAGIGWCSDCQASGGRCGVNSTFPVDDHTCYCPDGQAIGSCPSLGRSGPKISRKRAIVIATSTAACVLFLLLVVVFFLYIRKRRQYKMSSSSRLLKYTTSGGTPRSNNGSSGHSTMESGSFHYLQTHHFAYEELEEATDGFSDARELGDGGFGTVYKGELRDGRVVAVKRLYNNSCRRVEQFVNEAAILSRLRHPNLVLFYGCTSSRSRELLLVYEYVPNGTVADHLHGGRATERALTWPLRLDIAVEAAAALAYLHAVEPPIVHRDIKTNNILLDANFHVKVADFGLSRLFPRDATHVSTAPQGTPGYVDPEYHQCYQLTDKSDVYSFGVVLAELISSKPAVDVTRDRDEINLAGMAINKIQRCQVDQLVDHELGYDSDQATKKMMTMVAELAFRCLQHNGEMRPPIKEVFDVLRGIQEECRAEKKGSKRDSPCSPNTVHAPWDSRSTTPNTSQ